MSIPIADFAFLNDTPAGTHGFVQAREGRLIFDDGTPARFFGVNLSFDAAFPDAGTAGGSPTISTIAAVTWCGSTM